jgi:DUF4097 and DUF4098 domain-containing protein YvlB
MSRLRALTILGALVAIGAWAPPAAAQESPAQRSERWLERCRDADWGGNDLEVHCEVREKRMRAGRETIAVDGRQNGGVSVQGWDKDSILVIARVQTRAESDAEAKELAAQITIDTEGSPIEADGPSNRRHASWSVSFDVYVPRRSNLDLRTHNGGLRVEDVQGRMELEAHNGGLALARIGGDVRGETTNGGLSIELAGERWVGEGLDVRTTNGGVTMRIPANYSAKLETGTVNGGFDIDFPVTLQGRIDRRRLTTQLGGGGPTIRAVTTNGGVRVRKI